MRKSVKSSLGVTLLEVMLVLAIAAMIIVMSVRYYQSASSNQQANSVIQQITAIVADVESLSQTSGYTASTVSSTTIAPMLPTNGLMTPWGTGIHLNLIGPTSFSITIDAMPASVCPLVTNKLSTNNHFTATPPSPACSSSNADIVYTYKSNP